MKKILITFICFFSCGEPPLYLDNETYYDSINQTVCRKEEYYCLPVEGSVLFSDNLCLNAVYGLPPLYYDYDSRYTAMKDVYFELGEGCINNELTKNMYTGQGCIKVTINYNIQAYKKILRVVEKHIFKRF